jgi:hypothetical protein
LRKHIATPGDDLPTILINVRNDVMKETVRRQVPWEHSAMTARFYFIPPRPTEQQIELAFWTSVKDSTNPAVLGTYLERYPAGEFASIARANDDLWIERSKGLVVPFNELVRADRPEPRTRLQCPIAAIARPAARRAPRDTDRRMGVGQFGEPARSHDLRIWHRAPQLVRHHMIRSVDGQILKTRCRPGERAQVFDSARGIAQLFDLLSFKPLGARRQRRRDPLVSRKGPHREG